MKTLLILRHGKSDWSDPSLDDHDRPLKGRGKRASKRMGEVVRERQLTPDLIVTSSARRARMSAKRAANAMGQACEQVQDERLYMTGVAVHMKVIMEHATDRHECMMVVGHNPDMEALVAGLCNQHVTLKTADLACIDFDVDSWSDMTTKAGTLRFLARAREYE